MAAAAFMVTSCDVNEMPEFSDSDAFVAFSSTTSSVDENVEGGYVELPVTLTSLGGLNGTVDFEIVDSLSTAVANINYTIANESQTLTFTKDAPTQTIKFNVVDNDVYGGNLKICIKLTNPQGINLGADQTCTLTIIDNEHPLLFLFNDYSYHITDNWGDSYDGVGSITRDNDDDTKVWIHNILTPWFVSAGYTPNPFYGFVNADKTEIAVPAGQATGYSSGSSINLYVGSDPDLAGDMYDSGKSLIIKILDGGNTLFIENGWGCSNGSGWYEANKGNVTLTKK